MNVKAALSRAPALALAALLFNPGAFAAPFVVTDSDFVDGVYVLRYDAWTQALSKNGVVQSSPLPLSSLFLTNAGNTANPAWERASDGSVAYLQAPGICGGFGCGTNSTWNTSAAATMGFDFSALSGQIASIELVSSNHIFQFSPWHTHALGDYIYGAVATPVAFGGGTYTEMYRQTGNNADGTGLGALSTWDVDITSFLASGWLDDPSLLELKFGYELLNTDIPGRHLQLFRTAPGSEQAIGFSLRVTLVEEEVEVPEPATLLLIGLGLGLIFLVHQRRRASRLPARLKR